MVYGMLFQGQIHRYPEDESGYSLIFISGLQDPENVLNRAHINGREPYGDTDDRCICLPFGNGKAGGLNAYSVILERVHVQAVEPATVNVLEQPLRCK